VGIGLLGIIMVIKGIIKAKRTKVYRFPIVLIISGIFLISMVWPLIYEIFYPHLRSLQYRLGFKKPTCIANLKQIGLVLHMYAQDNEGYFPDSCESFTEIYPYYVSYPKTFWCPSDANNKRPPDIIDNWKIDVDNSFQISYKYTPGFSKDDVGAIILKDNTPANHEGKGVWALYGDGHVSWVPIGPVKQ